MVAAQFLRKLSSIELLLTRTLAFDDLVRER